MASSRAHIARNPLFLGIAAAAVAVLIFSGGAFAGRAMADDDAPETPPVSHGQVVPGLANDGAQTTLVAPAAGRDIATSGNAGATSPGSAAMPSGPCMGDISGVVNGATIDPSGAGLTPRFLSGTFKLQNVSLGADGCALDDNPAKTAPVLNSSWIQDDTSAYVNVMQRIAADPTSNVLTPGMAQFWSGGYAFTVNASPGMRPMTGTPPPDLPATTAPPSDARGGGTNSSSGTAGSPAIAPGEPYPGSADATAVLEEAIAQLAPDLDLRCFYRQSQGTWADLAALGIGDPRPAIPAGYVESSVNVRTFAPPAADCGTTVAPMDQAGFDASFIESGADGMFSGGIFINAGGYSKDYPVAVGHLDAYGAYWSNGTHVFSIGAKTNAGLGRDVIRAIALALDPQFDSACMSVTNEISDADARSAGFHTPSFPSGYNVESSQLQRTELSPACSGNPDGAQTGYSLQWTARSGSAVINANASRFTGQGIQPGSISVRGLSWSGADGTQYGVYGYTDGKDAAIDQDQLIAVAKSMDPALDVASLQKQSDDGTQASPPKTLPVPVP